MPRSRRHAENQHIQGGVAKNSDRQFLIGQLENMTNLIWEELAEACASRTHQRRGNPPPAGFEDHQECSDWL